MQNTSVLKWQTPPKPAAYAESQLIEAILNEHFPIDSFLPAERELAAQLGVTRPTLREALQRMARDGWIEIRHGRQTRVCDYWREGKLGVLTSVVQHANHLPEDLVKNLLVVRQQMAPTYIRLAVERAPEEVRTLLRTYENLEDTPADFARADWKIHHQLTIVSGNPIFTLILNGFADFYQTLARLTFQNSTFRQHTLAFYLELQGAASDHDCDQAESITRQAMRESLQLWQTMVCPS